MTLASHETASTRTLRSKPCLESASFPFRRRSLAPARSVEQRTPRTKPWLLRRLKALDSAANHWLACHLWPRVPMSHWPYDLQLRSRLVLSETRLLLPNLPRAWEGTSLLLLSDLHVGPFVSPATLEHTLGVLARLEPDIIAIAGDFVLGRYEELLRFRRALSQLDARLGAFAVLGNHDHYTNRVRDFAPTLEDMGIELLHNRCRAMTREGESLVLAGVDDLNFGRPDLEEALAGASTEQPTLLLAHNPDTLFAAAALGADVVLSGHTHGGQIRLPGLPPPLTNSRHGFDSGLYRFGSCQLVLSRGLGVVGAPVRFFCPPEAVWMTLHRAASE